MQTEELQKLTLDASPEDFQKVEYALLDLIKYLKKENSPNKEQIDFLWKMINTLQSIKIAMIKADIDFKSEKLCSKP